MKMKYAKNKNGHYVVDNQVRTMGFGLLCLFIVSASAASPPLIKIGNSYYTRLIEQPKPEASNRQEYQITFPSSIKVTGGEGGYDYRSRGTVPQSGGYPINSGGYEYDYPKATTAKPRGYEYRKPQGYNYPRPAPIAETTTTEAEPSSTTEQPEISFPDKDFELNKIPSAIGLETTEDNESVGLEPTPLPTPVRDQPDFELNYDEPCNLPDTEHSWPCGLANSIPGRAGEDYPIYSRVPKTSFRCPDYSGYFGDMESRCQSFHVCLTREHRPTQRYGFLCPNGTVFNQREFVCTWWTEFTCSDTPNLYKLNQDLDWNDADMIKRGSSMLKVTPYNNPAPAVPKKQPKEKKQQNKKPKSKPSSTEIIYSASYQTVKKGRTEVKKQRSESEAYEDKYDAEGFIVNRAPIVRFPPVKVTNPHGISIPNDPFEDELLQLDPQTPPTPAPKPSSTSPSQRVTYLPPRQPTYLPPKAETTPEVDEGEFEPAEPPPKTQPERDFVPPTQVVPTYLPPQKTYLPPARTTLPPLAETTTDQENQLSPESKIPETYPERDFETTPKPKLTYLPPGNSSFSFRSANNKLINDILGSNNIVDHLPENHGFSGFKSQGGRAALFVLQKSETRNTNRVYLPSTNALVPPAPQHQFVSASSSYSATVAPTQQSKLVYAQLPQRNYATSAPQQQRNYPAPPQPQQNYFPAQPQPKQNYLPSQPQQNYLPSQPQQNYLPAQPQTQQNYLPPQPQPERNYLPQQLQQNYLPPQPQPERNYLPQQPQQNYLPPQPQPQQNYLPPQPQPQQNYLPPQPQPQQNYLPPQPQPQQNYLPPQPQPQQNYLPPQPQPENNYQAPAQQQQNQVTQAQIPRAPVEKVEQFQSIEINPQPFIKQDALPLQPVYRQPIPVPVQIVPIQPPLPPPPPPTQFNVYPAPSQPVYYPPPQPPVYLQPQYQAPTPAVYVEQTPSPQASRGSADINPKDIPQLIRAINIHSSFLIGKDNNKGKNNENINKNPEFYEASKDTSIDKAQSYYGPLKVVSIPKLQNLLETPRQLPYQQVQAKPAAVPTFYATPIVQPTYQAPQIEIISQKPSTTLSSSYEAPKVQPTYQTKTPQIEILSQKPSTTLSSSYEAPKAQPIYQAQASKSSVPKVPSFLEFEAQKSYQVPEVAKFVETARSKNTYHKSTVAVPKVPSFYESIELQSKLQTPMKQILSVPTSATSTFYKGPQAESFQKSVTIHSSHYVKTPKATPHNPYYSPGSTVEPTETHEPQSQAPSIYSQPEQQQPEVIYGKPELQKQEVIYGKPVPQQQQVIYGEPELQKQEVIYGKPVPQQQQVIYGQPEQQQQEVEVDLEPEEKPTKYYSKPTHSFHTYREKPTFSSLDDEPSYKSKGNINLFNNFSYQKRPPTLLIPSRTRNYSKKSRTRTKGWF